MSGENVKKGGYSLFWMRTGFTCPSLTPGVSLDKCLIYGLKFWCSNQTCGCHVGIFFLGFAL